MYVGCARPAELVRAPVQRLSPPERILQSTRTKNGSRESRVGLIVVVAPVCRNHKACLRGRIDSRRESDLCLGE